MYYIRKLNSILIGHVSPLIAVVHVVQEISRIRWRTVRLVRPDWCTRSLEAEMSLIQSEANVILFSRH